MTTLTPGQEAALRFCCRAAHDAGLGGEDFEHSLIGNGGGPEIFNRIAEAIDGAETPGNRTELRNRVAEVVFSLRTHHDLDEVEKILRDCKASQKS